MQKPQSNAATGSSKTAATRKLYSIHLLLQERGFRGKVEAGARSYDFHFQPTGATLNNGKLEITGTMHVTAKGAKPRTARDVRATLAGMQGGLGAAPPTPAKYASPSIAPTPDSLLPRTEYTDRTAFAGVLYFHLSSLDGRALGVPLDLSRIQLNARMAPTSQIEREMHWFLSALGESVLNQTRDEDRMQDYLGGFNQLLKG
jgi:hypothetical protein